MNKALGARDGDAIAPDSKLTVKIIGTLDVRRGGERLDSRALGGPKCRQVLEILLLHLGRPVSKSLLIDLLWDGKPPHAALATLESYVSVLRRRLQPGMGKSGPLKTTTGGYLVDRDWVDLDLDRFEALVRAAEHLEPCRTYALLCEALELATAPLLGDEFLQGWAENERAFHASRVRGARVLAAETALRLGKTDEAIGWAHSALATEALDESAWTVLVLSLEQSGHPIEGLRTYENCRRLLDQELGCAPGPLLRDAQARMLRSTADGASEFGEVLAALLTLQQRIGGPGTAATLAAGPCAPARDSCEAAGTVVRRYLRRALAVA